MSLTRSSLLFHFQTDSSGSRWEELVEIYRPLIIHAAMQAGAGRSDLDDIAQSVLLKLVKVLPSFSYQRKKGYFRSWLRRVTTNQVIDLHRRHSRVLHVESRCLDETAAFRVEEGQGDPEFAAKLLDAAMHAVEQEFRPRTWECFRRHLLDQQPASEIASELKVSENAVYINSSRVMKRLREFCEFHGEKWEHADDFLAQK